MSAFRGTHAVDLRDQAVRILRRAIEHTEAHNSYAALQTLRTEGSAWWDEARLVPTVVLLGDDKPWLSDPDGTLAAISA